MPPFTARVPALIDLRNVPALSKRFAPELRAKEVALWASKSAPERFVMTELAKKIGWEPVQVAVPAFSRMRPFNDTEPALLMVSTAPTGMKVRPGPVIVPAVQLN